MTVNIDSNLRAIVEGVSSPNTPEQEHRARLFICGHARDTREAAAFLLMLGLAPA